MNTYTPPSGLTPAATQFTQGQPNASNIQAPPPGSPSSAYGSDQMLNSQLLEANAANVTLGTADKRQQYMTNSNLPAMSKNYDELARQLFEYDQGVLAPKFQGTNPGMLSDAPSFGRVEASPLGMTVEGAKLSADKGLYAGNNPQGAYQAQISQGDSIATLLNTLIGGMNSEFGARVGTYRSDRQAAQAAVDLVRGLMQDKQTALDRELTRQKESAGDPETQKSESRLLSEAKRGVTYRDLLSRYSSELPASRIRELYNQVNYYKKPAKETAEDEAKILAGIKNPSGDSGEYSNERTTRTLQSVDELMGQVNDFTTGGGSILSILPGTPARTFKAQVDTLKSSIAFNELQEMRNASKTGGALGQVSNIELRLLQSAIGALDTAQSPADFKKQLQKVKDSIQRFESAKGGKNNQKNNNKSNDPLGIR